MDTTIGFVPIVPPLQSLLRSPLHPHGGSAFKAVIKGGECELDEILEFRVKKKYSVMGCNE